MYTGHCRLSELNQAIKGILELSFSEPVWLVAEIAKVSAHGSGHTYLDLVERRGSDTLAQARATIWKYSGGILKEYIRVTGQSLKSGMQVLMLVCVQFSPVYGLSLNVQQIDAGYTLGEMSRRRQETIERLEEEGLLHKNRQLLLCLVPQRIAVITSPSAAGWEDLRSRLDNNPFGYKFHITLFPSLVQGDGAEHSLLAALREARGRSDQFDAILIIRGGGSVVDLSCFDSYPIASAVAGFPLPVLTGIGHERDTSVTDIVAFHRADTPTAAAEFLIDKLVQFDAALEEQAMELSRLASRLLVDRKLELMEVTARFRDAGQRQIARAAEVFDRSARRVSTAVRTHVNSQLQVVTELATRMELRAHDQVRREKARIEESRGRIGKAALLRVECGNAEVATIARTVTAHSPNAVLRRGFSITRSEGMAITSARGLPAGAVLETTLNDGTVTSRVEEHS